MRLKLVCTFRLLLWLDEGIEDDDQDLPAFRASPRIRTKIRVIITHRHIVARVLDYISSGLQTPRDVKYK